jgi:hypothetical protein
MPVAGIEPRFVKLLANSLVDTSRAEVTRQEKRGDQTYGKERGARTIAASTLPSGVQAGSSNGQTKRGVHDHSTSENSKDS